MANHRHKDKCHFTALASDMVVKIPNIQLSGQISVNFYDSRYQGEKQEKSMYFNMQSFI